MLNIHSAKITIRVNSLKSISTSSLVEFLRSFELFKMKLMNLEILSLLWFYLLLFAVAAPTTETLRLIFRAGGEKAVYSSSILNAPTLHKPCMNGFRRDMKKRCRRISSF